jgi:uncharacterized protein
VPTCRVLAIDGGGVRGVVAARVVAALEERAGRPVSALFDVVAGTSTGAVLALGLVCPDRDGRPRWSAREMVDVFAQGGPSIFDRSAWRAVWTLDGFLAPKYSAREMEVQLQARLGDRRLSEALRDVVVPTYDLRRREPYLLTRSSATGSGDPLLRRVAVASAAAPTYFPPVPVLDPQVGERWLVDGGVCVNNPTMTAYAHVRRTRPHDDVVVLSVGCGRLHDDRATARVRRGGALVWARPAIDVMLDGQEDAVDAEAQAVLGAGYWRLQADLPDSARRIDDGSLANMRALERSAEQLLEERTALLDAVCRRLLEPADAA